MPIHDWTRLRANRFHDFHQSWTLEIRNALNRGLLPKGYFALAEQITGGPEPDVVALELIPASGTYDDHSIGGIATLSAPPQVKHIARTEAEGLRQQDRPRRHPPSGRQRRGCDRNRLAGK